MAVRKNRHPKRNRNRKPHSLESLEPRQLLTAQPLISEFMAVNESTLQDQDGDYSDWIEITNVGDEALDLNDYSLTDDQNDPTQWRFPSVTLEPGEYLTVFASNKDRDTPGQELHTNFRLNAGGEYLALVAPNGTVIQSFDEYPVQAADVAYGIGAASEDVTLISESDAVRYFVPPDEDIQDVWMQNSFNDAAWPSGSAPLGYETGQAEDAGYASAVLATNPLGYWRFEETSGDIAANSGSSGSSLDGEFNGGVSLNVSGPGTSSQLPETNSAAQFDGTNDSMLTSGSILSNVSQFTMMGFIRPGTFSQNRVGLFGQNDAVEFGFINPQTLHVWTPNGGSLNVTYSLPRNEWHHVAVVGTGSELQIYLDGVLAGTGGNATGNYGASNFGFNVGGGGIFDATGNEFTGMIDEVSVTNQALTAAEISAVLAGGTGQNTDFTPHINTDVKSPMLNQSSTLYTRVTFNLTDPGELNDLILKAKYDDGFVAYLNGNEVLRINAPGEIDSLVPYNANATTAAADSQAVQLEAFDISDSRDALVAGTNVLAIHALNRTADNADFLWSAELIGTRAANDVDSYGYLTTPTPGEVNNPASADLGPLVRDVEHSPSQPGILDSVLVTAEVSRTLNQVATVELIYRVMYEAEQTIVMADNGTNGDATAGDGIYSAIIPAGVAQPGEMLRWYVKATDTLSSIGRNPLFEFNTGRNQSAEYHGTMIADPSIDTDMPVLNWFVESESRAGGRSGTRASLYYNGEFYDNMFVRQRGGSTANNPVGKTNFKFDFKGDTFRFDPEFARVEEFNLNSTATDKSYVRQPLAFDAYRMIGVPSSISFPMYVRRNDEFYGIFEFIEEPDEEMLERSGLDPDGALYKMYNEFTSASGARKKTREYEGSTDLAEFVRDINRLNGAELKNYLFDNVDIPAVLNYLVATVITHQNDNPHKNHFLYRDSNGSGEWMFIPWDHDLTWGSNWVGTSFSDVIYADQDSITVGPVPGHDPSVIHPSHPFINSNGYREWNNHWNRLMDAMINEPTIQQMFLRRLRTAMDELLGEPGTSDSYLDQRFLEYLDQMQDEAQEDAAVWADPWVWGSNQSMAQAIQVIRDEYLEVRRTHLYQTHSVDNLVQQEHPEIIPEFTSAKYFVPTDNSLARTWTTSEFDDSSWAIGETGIGFGTSTGFEELTRTTVNPSDVSADSTSVYMRIPFTVNNANSLQALTLQMKYDDGFVAFINGVEVTSANTRDEVPEFDSRARSHRNSDAIEFENFVINLPAGLLRNGENVLAIHGLNSSTASNDMLFVPRLVEGAILSVDVAGIPHGQESNPAIRINSQDLDVNPASGNQDEEYLRLDNPTDQAVDISGWHLTGGIEHTFRKGTIIPAGGSIYVSPNVAAFRLRASGPSGGQGLLVQGNYQGNLSGFGETIQLLAADGQMLDSFTTAANPSVVQQNLRVTEIHYNPAGTEEGREFIEFKNIGSTTLDLSGVTVAEGPSVPFVFSAGTTLAPGAYGVIVQNMAAFQQA
ncbi:MAG: lamin tail domain-containing protein, partial [Planctomycetales bacterium]|nr:lamin tail domain-containing protein [Planctomycetales bacterium]